MTIRTVQILGQGFGTNPASIAVTVDGVEVFAGNVNTLPLANIPSLPNLALANSTVELMSFDVPVNYSGTKAMTCTVTSGIVIFAQIIANYQPIPNPVYTPEEWAVLTNPASTTAEKIAIIDSHAVPPFSTAEIAILESTDPIDQPAKDAILASHGVSKIISGGSTVYSDIDGQTDPRDNVTIDGVAVTPDHGSMPGTWWFTIEEGQTLGYNLTIEAGLE